MAFPDVGPTSSELAAPPEAWDLIVTDDDRRPGRLAWLASQKRQAKFWALGKKLTLGERGKGDFAELAAHLPVSNIADRLSLTDVGRQVILSSPMLRERLTKEISRLDHAWHDERLPEVARLLSECYEEGDDEGKEEAEWTAFKFARCHHVEWWAVGFHVHTADNGDQTVAVQHQRERCWLRICPKCARDISARLRLRYAARLAILELHKPRGFGWRHLTLTMKRGEHGRDLRADLELMHKAAKKLVHHFWTKRNHWASAFATFEIGPRGGNVHVHAMIWGPFVLQADISAYWKKLTGNPVVDIRKKTTAEVLREGLKYVMKFSRSGPDDVQISPSDLVEVHLALKGKRRVWAWGRLADPKMHWGEAEEEAKGDVERDAGLCNECRSPMLWARVAELRRLLGLSAELHSKRETNCITETASSGPDRSAIPPGGACAPPGGAIGAETIGQSGGDEQ